MRLVISKISSIPCGITHQLSRGVVRKLERVRVDAVRILINAIGVQAKRDLR